MDVDSPPPDFIPLRPRDRVVRRLAQFGVPEELLDYSGLVTFARSNAQRIPELVAVILPLDEEVAEVIREVKAKNKKSPMGLNMKSRFRESLLWLQWLMFEEDPDKALKKLAMTGQRGVCGSVWGNNDIAYRCRTCEHDPTCAICVPCFENGNHNDHDYSIIYTGGGCCDCGDVTAWKRDGFCSKHKGAEQIQPLPDKFVKSVGSVIDALFRIWEKKLASVDSIEQENIRTTEYRKAANELTVVVVEMLLEFCRNSESLLSFVSKRVISVAGLLDVLVRAERFLSDAVVKKLQELLLKLLGEPVFKYEFAKVFLGYYPVFVSEAIREGSDNVIKKYPLLSTFSVQIFTVPTLTPRLVKEMNLLVMLFGCMGDIFVSCAGEDGCLQLTKWAKLYETTNRVIGDIRFVLSHVSVSKYATHEQPDISRTWMRLLAFVQGMDPLKRETGIHVKEENEHMHLPLVLDHNIANIQPLLVDGAFAYAGTEELNNGFDINRQDNIDGDSLRHAKVGRLSQESSVCGAIGRSSSSSCTSKVVDLMSDDACHLLVPPSVTWLTLECLRAMESWLGVDDVKSASFGGVLSPNTSCSSSSNFQALKKTLSKIRKGKNIFSRLTGSSEVAVASIGMTTNSDPDNGKSLGKDCRTTGADIDIIGNKSGGSEDSGVEGDCAVELNALRILSLSYWPDLSYDVSSQDVSVHIPLHRLLSLILQRALKRCYGESGVSGVSNVTAAGSENAISAANMDFFSHILGGANSNGFSAFIMEHPLRIRVFCAQVHAGMWRKNGDAAMSASEWYRSVRWSEQGLELDLFLLQCCAALAPPDLFVNRIIERFGLSSYFSLNLERSTEYEPVLVQEMLTIIVQIIQERRFCGLTTSESLKRELVHKLAIGDATHSQLVKSLPRDLSKFEKLQEILDEVALYSNPSGFNQGMYSLRWTYWKELDLYHPRWNSRDLQVAEERYLRFCSASAFITQLPCWTKIYQPLQSVANIATCKVILQLIRAVLFYAVFTDKSIESRASHGILLTALHLLALGLDVCDQQRKSGEVTSNCGDSMPILAFASEEITEGLSYSAGKQSLLSLLVALMGMHKKENADNFLEVGNSNLSPLIESLLKKFAEFDTKCMNKLQELAPQVVSHFTQSLANADTSAVLPSSDSEKRKAKARERQAAILAKMKAEQSKFLSSISSTAEDGLTSSPDVSNSDDELDSEESVQHVCSLCHDPNSKAPVTFLILLQKSRLLSFVDRGPPSWEHVQRSGKEQAFTVTNRLTVQSETSTSSPAGFTSSQLVQMFENAVSQFAYSASNSDEVNAVLEFCKARLPSLSNIQAPCAASNGRETSSLPTLEMFERDVYTSIREELHVNTSSSNFMEVDGHSSAEGCVQSNGEAESILLGKYIAALMSEMRENPSASEVSHDKSLAESTSQHSVYDGFGPVDCDGIHVSSCGHAVHQGCLDRYLSSLKDRFNRRIIFEGGHIVDPDQGEFLCPVCRQLANSVLPALPGDFQKVCKESMIAEPMATSMGGNDSLWLQQALSLIQTAANEVGKGDFNTLPPQRNPQSPVYLDPISRVICKYFKEKHDKISGPARVSPSMIMWDILKYSIMSMEVSCRSERTSLTPIYDVNALYKELKSSNGFIMSLLLKVVQSMRTKDSIHVLQRFRGIQLFAKSICSGVSIDHPGSTCEQGGNFLNILKLSDDVLYPDIQFWNRASDPVLARDPFSSLMWVLYCLPYPFVTCQESIIALVHAFYAVAITQAIIVYRGKLEEKLNELGFSDCLITDISNILGEYGHAAQEYFCSNYIDPSCHIKDMIRKLSFPYLRRCALLLKLLSSTVSVPFSGGDSMFDQSFRGIDMMDSNDCSDADLLGVQELEKTFKIPPLDVVLNNGILRSIVSKWLHHFCKQFEIHRFQCVLYSTPAVPFKLMQLPHLYQDLLQRYIKQSCPECKSVLEEPALCLFCGKLCSPNWKSCCRESGSQTHAMACGAGTGVFLLIRRTTILLQRCARQAPWPSVYLDTYGEEDVDMQRGKPLYLNEERYAALTYMVASHGLDRSSRVLGQTTMGGFLLL